jgi:hypothetical protein
MMKKTRNPTRKRQRENENSKVTQGKRNNERRKNRDADDDSTVEKNRLQRPQARQFETDTSAHLEAKF